MLVDAKPYLALEIALVSKSLVIGRCSYLLQNNRTRGGLIEKFDLIRLTYISTKMRKFIQ